MWLSLVAITVTTLCVFIVSGDTVQQPMEVDARQQNAHQDILGIEKGPKKTNMDTAPVQKKTKPKGISGRFKPAIERMMGTSQGRVDKGAGRMYHLADKWVRYVKSNLNEDELKRVVVEIPQKKMLELGEYIKYNLLNNVPKKEN